ncbi:hypothetical protein CSUB01_04585 [Colletotrichum sublineola]|uniref:Uncharacterized protein n=1 Tax=Colletotrichum sublineola TaxID=1173701 RepID=A0A066WX39_COLSU|nr:hypothetical protein CSUB01_04585 [Colletotrichum sublineola]
MSQTPKHFVFMVLPPGTRLMGNSAATFLAQVTQPENLETFLCHWINPAPSQQPIETQSTTSFQDYPKVVMLLNRQEIGRLTLWCNRYFTQTEQRLLCTPKIITEFYGLIEDVESMYFGLCQIKHNPQHGLCWWEPPDLGLPFITGVRWTESACQFIRMSSTQTWRPGMDLTGLLDLSLSSGLGSLPTPGSMTPAPQQMGNASFLGGQSLVGHPNGMTNSSRGLPRTVLTEEDVEMK